MQARSRTRRRVMRPVWGAGWAGLWALVSVDGAGDGWDEGLKCVLEALSFSDRIIGPITIVRTFDQDVQLRISNLVTNSIRKYIL